MIVSLKIIYHKIKYGIIWCLEEIRYTKLVSRIIKDKSCLYISCLGGIGDTVFLLSLLNEFKRQRKVSRIKFITKFNHKPIFQMYEIKKKDIIAISDDDALILRRKKHKRISNYLYGHPDLEILYPEEILLMPGITLLDLYKVSVLHIDINSQIKRIALRKMGKGLKSNMIILAPYCVSTPGLKIEFWEKLVETIRTDFPDYDIYTNVKDETELAIKKTMTLKADLKQLCNIATNCRLFITVRSGICDLLAMCGIDMVILYPNEMINATYQKYNLRDMGLCEKNREFVIDSEKEQEFIINKIEKLL